MNELELLERFKDMVTDKVELLKGVDFQNVEDYEVLEVHGAIVELNTLIFATKELTLINETVLKDYVQVAIGRSLSEMEELENSFY
ncbi:gp20 [Brochothrix phage A9]|uniref:Gp20 n=1 Tax=Brochothrix phage A9 TaxID=857312 RepID=D9J0G7_9CAUD|nr:gp20 [Brochothrix phage A9]ADJ53062.1 gp20 [Brochothrix phage A9]